jgi:hypothetical protein
LAFGGGVLLCAQFLGGAASKRVFAADPVGGRVGLLPGVLARAVAGGCGEARGEDQKLQDVAHV